MEIHAVKTWVDLKHGGVVEVEDDVQNVIRELKEISPRLHVFYNEQTEGFDVVEHCLDGVQRLVMQTRELDKRVVTRIREADHWHGRDVPLHILSDEEDFATDIERHNEGVEEARDEAFREIIRADAEKLHWALDIGPGQNSAGGKIALGGKRYRTRYG